MIQFFKHILFVKSTFRAFFDHILTVHHSKLKHIPLKNLIKVEQLTENDEKKTKRHEGVNESTR